MQTHKRKAYIATGIIIVAIAISIALVYLHRPSTKGGDYWTTRRGDYLFVQIEHFPGLSDCPSYRLSIYGNGNVVFHLSGITGEESQAKVIGQDEIRDIISIIQDTDFFFLDDGEAFAVRDAPISHFYIKLNNDTRYTSVAYYRGVFTSPSTMDTWARLEFNLIQITGAEEWIGSRCGWLDSLQEMDH